MPATRRAPASLLMLALAVTAFAQTGVRISPAGEPPADLRTGRAALMGHFNPQQTLRLAIGLSHPHLEEEEQCIEELTTPGSANFRRFLTADEYNARFAPSAADEQAVVDWAVSQGMTITNRFDNRLIVNVEAPAAILERALRITINAYLLENYVFFSNEREPVIPNAVSSIIRSIGGLNNFPQMYPAASHGIRPPGPVYREGPVIGAGHTSRADAAATAPNFAGGFIDPMNIYSSYAYNYAGLQSLGLCCNPLANSAGSPKESSIALATYGNLHWNGSEYPDLVGFQNKHQYLAYNVTTVPIDGGAVSCGSCADDSETALDTEWSTATSNSLGANLNTAHVWVYEAPNSGGSGETMYNTMLSDNHARVFSTSWDCVELYGCPGSQMDTDHGIFNAMLLQGWTLMAAAGDGGSTADCQHVSVNYPASDPDVIGVGGTDLVLNTSDGTYSSETAWTGATSSGSCSSNSGGSGGGCSAHFAVPLFQSGANGTCGANRSVPDMALNAIGYQDYYFNGSLSGVGGTSIASPMLAGFFAQAEAYLLYIGSITGNKCGPSHVACTPIGGANTPIYYFGRNPNYAPHYPFYDITSGCNSNDITASGGLAYFCATTGYDNVTGWGSANMLQLSWAINTYVAGDSGAPAASFSGLSLNHWYNTTQTAAWTISDTSSNGAGNAGVAGFTYKWDADPGDDYRKLTPGAGSNYYAGPAAPLSTTGSQSLNAASGGEGCHTLHVRSWDNSGFTADQTFGPLCFDDIPPFASCASPDGQWHAADASIACTAGDTYSGLASPSDASFNLTTSVPAGTETNNASTNNHTVFDRAGNSIAEGPVAGNKVDKKPPTITINQPTATTYSAGSNLILNYSVTDAGSGVASSTPTMNGNATGLSGTSINLANLPVGSNTFTVSAVDNVGNHSSVSVTFTITPVPVLSLTMNHVGNFIQGQTAATYNLTVSNAAGAAATSGIVTVTETVPIAGLKLVSMAGTGWTWTGGNTCTRNDALLPGASFQTIVVTVSVACNAPASVIDQASVSVGSAAANASDPTAIAAAVTVSGVQATINQALGAASSLNDLNLDGVVNVVDVQIAIDALLGLNCSGS